jgi:hypothetical protein
MLEYRVYTISADERILSRVDLVCEGHDVAKETSAACGRPRCRVVASRRENRDFAAFRLAIAGAPSASAVDSRSSSLRRLSKADGARVEPDPKDVRQTTLLVRLRALAQQVLPALSNAQPSLSIGIVTHEVGLPFSVCRLLTVLLEFPY